MIKKNVKKFEYTFEYEQKSGDKKLDPNDFIQEQIDKLKKEHPGAKITINQKITQITGNDKDKEKKVITKREFYNTQDDNPNKIKMDELKNKWGDQEFTRNKAYTVDKKTFEFDKAKKKLDEEIEKKKKWDFERLSTSSKKSGKKDNDRSRYYHKKQSYHIRW